MLRFETGAVGAFVNTRRQSTHVVDISFTSDGPLTTIRRTSPLPHLWEVEFRDGYDVTVLPPGRDPYEIQAETFLDAVVAGDPLGSRRLPTPTRSGPIALTRAVVAATGAPG